MSNLILRFIKKGFGKKIVVNCGSGKGHKIKDALKIIMNELNINLIPRFNKLSDSNPSTLIANISVAKKFGWSPKKKLTDGLKDYVKWYKKIFT